MVNNFTFSTGILFAFDIFFKLFEEKFAVFCFWISLLQKLRGKFLSKDSPKNKGTFFFSLKKILYRKFLTTFSSNYQVDSLADLLSLSTSALYTLQLSRLMPLTSFTTNYLN